MVGTYVHEAPQLRTHSVRTRVGRIAPPHVHSLHRNWTMVLRACIIPSAFTVLNMKKSSPVPLVMYKIMNV